MARVPERLMYKGKMYRRAGSFTTKSAASRYAKELRARNGYGLVRVIDAPREMGVGVKYHTYTRG